MRITPLETRRKNKKRKRRTRDSDIIQTFGSISEELRSELCIAIREGYSKEKVLEIADRIIVDQIMKV